MAWCGAGHRSCDVDSRAVDVGRLVFAFTPRSFAGNLVRHIRMLADHCRGCFRGRKVAFGNSYRARRLHVRSVVHLQVFTYGRRRPALSFNRYRRAMLFDLRSCASDQMVARLEQTSPIRTRCCVKRKPSSSRWQRLSIARNVMVHSSRKFLAVVRLSVLAATTRAALGLTGIL